MQIQAAIARLMAYEDLSQDEMMQLMHQIMSGEADDAQIAGFLVALRMKGETVAEISGAAQVMRELATAVNVEPGKLVDIVGTGGDGASIFNVSTASCFVVAAGGGCVAKHGNRSVSSNSGAADVLEAAGVDLNISPQQVAQCVEHLGVGFMFAIKHHGAMKHAIGPRKSLAARTVFNLLGPLTNPAGVKRQLLGVYDRQWLLPVAKVLQTLGSEHAMVVHAADGLDEISLNASTFVAELKGGVISEYEIQPEDVGLNKQSLDGLVVENAEQSLALIKQAFKGSAGAAADIIALNAGAALYVAGICADLHLGVELAQDLMASGQALQKLNEFVEFTRLLGKQSQSENS